MLPNPLFESLHYPCSVSPPSALHRQRVRQGTLGCWVQTPEQINNSSPATKLGNVRFLETLLYDANSNFFFHLNYPVITKSIHLEINPAYDSQNWSLPTLKTCTHRWIQHFGHLHLTKGSFYFSVCPESFAVGLERRRSHSFRKASPHGSELTTDSDRREHFFTVPLDKTQGSLEPGASQSPSEGQMPGLRRRERGDRDITC